MEQSLKLKVSQQLIMTAQMQQSLKLLQYSNLDLRETIAQAIEQNPLLESVAYENADGVGQSLVSSSYSWDDEFLKNKPAPISLSAYLTTQLGMVRVDKSTEFLVKCLINELDDNGYLESSLEEVAQALEYQGIVPTDLNLNQWEEALAVLQSFEPTGIGARNLSDCLLLQLKPRALHTDPVIYDCAVCLCHHGLSLLSQANLKALEQLTGQPFSVIQQAHHLIKQLNPKPAHEWMAPVANAVVPDVLVRALPNAQWQVVLNPQVQSPLRIRAEYDQLLESMQRQALSHELIQQWQAARQLLVQLKLRETTLLSVAQAMMQVQESFLNQGVKGIQPLTLHTIAHILGVHESTVSRACQHKYIKTPHGVFALSYFFSAGVGQGQVASAKSIHDQIQTLIQQEDKNKPLSDSRLVSLLKKEGIEVARRTVAKYREQLGIGSASERKATYQLHGEPI